MDNESEKEEINPARREFIRDAARGASVIGMTFAIGGLVPASAEEQGFVWQINPHKCTECGRCADECILQHSAVKAVHAYGMCGYCDLCTAYFKPEPYELNEGAENHMCPTDAVRRKHIDGPYYEYHIDEEHCVGCAKCVDGCRSYGNGSMHLQIQQDICVDCNSCSIAIACPSDSFEKVPADNPYLFKTEEDGWHQ